MIKHFFAGITSNVISLVGTVLILVSLLLIAALLIMQGMGFEGGAYLGIITFVVLPMAFLLGLALVPIGLWWRKRKDAKLAAQGKETGHLPIFDLNQERTRGVLLGFVALAVPLFALAAGLTFKAIHYMDSDEFCGMACHKVMEPEYTAFQRSPHARVGCAGCHIGPGAEWFVKAKISGSWQLIAVAFDLYPRPIPTPVHSLRPANGTCEQCHWPTKFLGDRLKVRTHYAEDEANTEVKTALMIKVGGKQAGQSQGIHWHVDPNHQVRYRADPSREIMYEVELTDLAEGGTTKLFKGAEPAPEGTEWRTMDCVDCHNRASHIYRSPEFEVDLALEEGRIDRSLPYIRREGLRIITEKEYASHAEARAGDRGGREGVLRAELRRPRWHACRRAGRQGAGRRLRVEQLPAHEGEVEHLQESHRAPGLARLLPLSRQQAQDGRRRKDRQEVQHLPQHRGRGRVQLQGVAGTRPAGAAARAGGSCRSDGGHGSHSRAGGQGRRRLR